MTAITIYHNPRCSNSNHAVDTARNMGVSVEVVHYLETPLDGATLRSIIARLEDPLTDLVRRDDRWTELGLTDADVATPEQVVEVLVQHPALMQRPVLVTPATAIIGRPKERVPGFLAAADDPG